MVEILKNLITKNYQKGTNRKIEYIVLHYTAGVSSKNGRACRTRDMFNTSDTQASAHYIVDDANIIQAVEDKDISWHCGTTGTYKHKLCRNSNSIGIEICSNHSNFTSYADCPASDSRWYFTEEAKETAAQLTAYLCKKYNLDPNEAVIRHYDVTGKDCPSIWVDENKEGFAGWLKFKLRVMEIIKGVNEVENVYIEKLEDCPAWCKEALTYFVKEHIIDGVDNKGTLNISYDLARTLVIIYRLIEGGSL